ncbi:hypothetical protein [Actinomadura atramentaria]|uniref:hypothetical protein n=1 Tax=Actinomadura atramentaria TaxID=1990 RepID=UPI00037E33F3|nr:hypothetical protein [Actinomadura atramentaria]
MASPTAFLDLRPEQFPIKIELIDYDTDELWREETLPEPGALKIPPAWPRVMRARVTYGDGEVIDQPPAIKCPACGFFSERIVDVRNGYCRRCRKFTCRG